MHEVHLSSIDLNLLVVLQALLETRSVKEAARRVSLSPSATSHALARLRELLDDALLVRAGRRLVLTPRGERLRPQLSRVLEDVQHVLTDGAEIEPATLRRSFTMATNDYGERMFVVPLSQRLATEAPGVDLYATRSPTIAPAIREGDQDLGIGVMTNPPPDVEWAPLLSDRFVCLLRPGHPIGRKKLTLERYAELDHILVAPGGTPRGVVDSLLESRGLHRRVARTLTTFGLGPHLVVDSNYVLTTAERIARPIAEALGLQIRRAPEPLAGFRVCMAWHRRSHDDPAHQWLRQQVLDVAREARGGRS